MWWECSECGGALHGEHAPSVCRICGRASARFVENRGDDYDDVDSVRAAWLRAGVERARYLRSRRGLTVGSLPSRDAI